MQRCSANALPLPLPLQLMEEHGVGYSTTGLVAQMREQDFTWKQASAARVLPGGAAWVPHAVLLLPLMSR